jgi:SAM-dependent methyltransferase
MKPVESSWRQDALGQYIQSQEQVFCDQVVGNIFGFNALQLGMLEADLLKNCRIPYKIKLSEYQGDVYCDAEQLPIADNTIDLMLLPHVLDFSGYPQQALREAERVLVPEGYLVLTGFNPVSTWGLRRFFSKRCAASSALWQAHFFSPMRIKYWLHLLGFEVVSTQMVCHHLPFQRYRWLKRFELLERLVRRFMPMLGGVYCVVAKKRVLGMRVIKPNWKTAKMRPRFATTPSQKEEIIKNIKQKD